MRTKAIHRQVGLGRAHWQNEDTNTDKNTDRQKYRQSLCLIYGDNSYPKANRAWRMKIYKYMYTCTELHKYRIHIQNAGALKTQFEPLHKLKTS